MVEGKEEDGKGELCDHGYHGAMLKRLRGVQVNCDDADVWEEEGRADFGKLGGGVQGRGGLTGAESDFFASRRQTKC